MRILIASQIDETAIEALARDHDVITAFAAPPDEIERLLRDRDVLVFRSGVTITRSAMEGAPDLDLVIRAGSGLDNIDLECVRDRGYRFERIEGPGAQAVAELAFAFMLALSRQLPVADRLTRQGVWAKHDLSGHLVAGKTLGVLGCGNIGRRVGEMGRAWGMRVLGSVSTGISVERPDLLEREIALVDQDELLRESDYVVVVVPLTDDTRGLIGSDQLRQMRSGAFLVNVSRGGVVDEHALSTALRSVDGPAGAAADVHEHEGPGTSSPLADLDNVILTPHIGAMTVDSQRQIGERVRAIVADHQHQQREL